jgi:hypothetical protein
MYFHSVFACFLLFFISSKACCMLSKRLYVCAQRFLYMFLICFRNSFLCFLVLFVWVPTFYYVFQSCPNSLCNFNVQMLFATVVSNSSWCVSRPSCVCNSHMQLGVRFLIPNFVGPLKVQFVFATLLSKLFL